MDRVLGKLPREQAEALMLRFVHDVSANEIASLCDVPLDTIKTRLKRGKTALRRRLALPASLEASTVTRSSPKPLLMTAP